MCVGVLHRREGADAMVEQHGRAPLRGARASDKHHKRHLLGIGACDGVHRAEAADAPRHADTADAVDPRIGVGGIPGVELIAGADELDAGIDQPIHERQNVVARHAERMLEAGLLQALQKIGGDGRFAHDERRAFQDRSI